MCVNTCESASSTFLLLLCCFISVAILLIDSSGLLIIAVHADVMAEADVAAELYEGQAIGMGARNEK